MGYRVQALEGVLQALKLASVPCGIGINSLVHLIPFLVGERQSCRLILSTPLAEAIRTNLTKMGYAVSGISVSRRELGPDWWEFQPSTAGATHKLLAAAGDRAIADEIASSECDGRFQVSGALLEYPDCCVEAYAEISSYHAHWPSYYLSRSWHVSAWCNRLAVMRGGSCPTGELFPCSLTCSKAIDLGKRNMAVLDNLGLKRLRETIWHDASSSLALGEEGKFVPRERCVPTPPITIHPLN